MLQAQLDQERRAAFFAMEAKIHLDHYEVTVVYRVPFDQPLLAPTPIESWKRIWAPRKARNT